MTYLLFSVMNEFSSLLQVTIDFSNSSVIVTAIKYS